MGSDARIGSHTTRCFLDVHDRTLESNSRVHRAQTLYYLRPVKDYQSHFLKNGLESTYFEVKIVIYDQKHV